jgi:drug/metabolite transporter (DMT)-like permease
MGEFVAILAAMAIAFGTVLQQKGALSTQAGQNDPRFLVEILHQPVWLAGLLAQVVGWILQAVALDNAALTVVQSLLALSLVMALPLGIWLTDQHIGRREWTGAAFTLVGIVVFLAAGQPQGGTSHPGAAAWWTAGLIISVLVVALAGLGIRFGGGARALTFGAAAGLGFGLQAAVTKTFVTEVGTGLPNLLSSWTVYVLIVSAISGFVLQQSALKTGVLAPAMASTNSVTLFSSVVLGVTVYGESLSRGGGAHVGLAYAGLAVAILGIALLAGSAPPAEVSPPPTTRLSPSP